MFAKISTLTYFHLQLAPHLVILKPIPSSIPDGTSSFTDPKQGNVRTVNLAYTILIFTLFFLLQEPTCRQHECWNPDGCSLDSLRQHDWIQGAG